MLSNSFIFYCAPKNSTGSYVDWDGTNVTVTKHGWYYIDVEPRIYLDEDRYNCYHSNGVTHHIFEGCTKFVKMKDRIRPLDPDEFWRHFRKLYHEKCAPIEEVMEFVIYKGDRYIYPEWFMNILNKESFNSFKWDGKPYVILKNKDGKLKDISLELFKDQFCTNIEIDYI